MNPADRRAQALEARAIPQRIIDAAPTSPWGFPTELFRVRARTSTTRPIATPTTVRALEAAARRDGKLVAQNGSTDIFIHPPAKIRHADCLLTNFHLPRSTLLMLVAVLAVVLIATVIPL